MVQLAIVPRPAATLGNLTTSSQLGAIRLSWTIPVDRELFATEVWASQTNDLDTATLIDTVLGSTYLFGAATGENWYFWIRASNIFGRTDGDWYPPNGAASNGDTGWITHGSVVNYDYPGTGTWANLSNTAAADGSFATATVNSGAINDLAFYNYGLSGLIDADATITALQVQVKGKVSSATYDTKVNIALSWDGAAYQGDDDTDALESTLMFQESLTTSNTAYTVPATPSSLEVNWGKYKSFGTGTTRAITTADLFSSSFGVEVGCWGGSSNNGKTYSLDYVAIKVYWTLGGGVFGTASDGSNGQVTVSDGPLNVTGDNINVTGGNINVTGGNINLSGGSVAAIGGDVNSYDGDVYSIYGDVGTQEGWLYGSTASNNWDRTLGQGLTLGDYSAIVDYAGDVWLCNNCYYDGSNWRYLNSAAASKIELYGNTAKIDTANSGTAGDVITWSTPFQVVGGGTVAIGMPSLATNATSGFAYIPRIGGTPSGTPTSISGYSPIAHDQGNNKLWLYNGSAWKSVTLS